MLEEVSWWYTLVPVLPPQIPLYQRPETIWYDACPQQSVEAGPWCEFEVLCGSLTHEAPFLDGLRPLHVEHDTIKAMK